MESVSFIYYENNEITRNNQWIHYKFKSLLWKDAQSCTKTSYDKVSDRTYYPFRHLFCWNRQFGQIKQYHRNQDKIKRSTISNKTLYKALKVVAGSTTILLDIYVKQKVMNIMISLKPTVTEIHRKS